MSGQVQVETDEVLDALDSLLVLAARVAGRIDPDQVERLLDALPKIERLLPLLDLLEKIDPAQLEALLPLLDKAPNLLESIDKLMPVLEKLDPQALDALIPLLPRLADLSVKLDPLLGKLDETTLNTISRLLDALPGLMPLVEKLVPCISGATQRFEAAEPVRGIRGLLGVLKDKDVQEGLGRLVELLRALGRCETK